MRRFLLLLLLGACADATTSSSEVSLPTAATGAEAPAPPPQEAAPQATPTAGIDVSHIQGQIDWAAVVATGQDFVFIKATQGNDWVDPNFATNWQGSGKAGLKRGPYHFYQPGDDPQTQATNFLGQIQIGPQDLPPVLDIETAVEGQGQSEASRQLLSDIKNWLDQVEKATGKTPIIYTSPGFWNSLGDHDFGKYPLWVAEYGVQQPKPVAGWTTWTYWQYSESGTVAGIDHAVDLSRRNE